MRYFLEIAFDGKDFVGWQIQSVGTSVQGTMNQVLSTILKEPIYCVGCGRTDAGVHAKQFYLHFDTQQPIEDITLFMLRVNGICPKTIAAYRLIPVSDSAHARFDATSRTYQYHIHTKKNPFAENKSYFLRFPIDINLMNEACKMLIGEKDFKVFSRVNDLKHHRCTVYHAGFSNKDELIVFEIAANRFLRNMVRAIVGTLIDIGKGKKSLNDLAFILQQQERRFAGQSIAAHGLYLTKISYPYIQPAHNG
jgi:tRNA pseudouridine38-40 synthase